VVLQPLAGVLVEVDDEVVEELVITEDEEVVTVVEIDDEVVEELVITEDKEVVTAVVLDVDIAEELELLHIPYCG
jgi:hypothetical protein